ncbi:CoA ester lyase [Jatrophihabitans cynanchi]|uniref:CoA ester lyase n=1 Tax=Jatrophihabitans cynanchi TaxID=2944128 RepID=A0ABY7K067_9ACTN|nr:CoA ester lyase [Jatrophihabitans sp. SB3-54]WAX58240.1 CoA ester lyase [Jatrophihabitans sp. SB3-54]
MLPVTWLYVPADRPDRYAKAVASGADVVILDLEDAVVPAHKTEARATAVRWLGTAAPGSVEVRVNALDTPWAQDDLRALSDVPALRAVRLPKVQSVADVAAAVALLGAVRCGLHCLIESARGVEAAYEIASSPRVTAIGLGEADLAADLGVSDAAGLAWCRSRVVVAARAAGLPAPVLSVYPNVTDLTGLRAGSLAGRRLGFLGRAAIHPRQVPVIAEVFRPSEADVADARAVIEAFAREPDAGVIALEDGRMIDPALIRQARSVIDRAAP